MTFMYRLKDDNTNTIYLVTGGRTIKIGTSFEDQAFKDAKTIFKDSTGRDIKFYDRTMSSNNVLLQGLK